jgi:hypothetical protein
MGFNDAKAAATPYEKDWRLLCKVKHEWIRSRALATRPERETRLTRGALGASLNYQ